MGQGQVWRSWRVEGLPRRYIYLYTFIYLCTFIYLYTFIYSYTFIYFYTFIYLYLYVYPGDLWLPDIELYNTKVTNVTPIFGCLRISHPGEIVSWSLTLSDFHSVGVSGPFGDHWDQTSRPESYSAYAWQVQGLPKGRPMKNLKAWCIVFNFPGLQRVQSGNSVQKPAQHGTDLSWFWGALDTAGWYQGENM